jgi:hypothetical protein
MSAAAELIIDLSEPTEKVRLSEFCSRLRGKQRITAVQYRPRRTDPQNRLYWGVIVEALRNFLREQGEAYTAEEVHGILKHKFLRKTVHDPLTGQPIGETTRSTTELTIQEFNEYIEFCTTWLNEMFGIVIPTI